VLLVAFSYYTQEIQKVQLFAQLQQWFKVGDRPALWRNVCSNHGINFLVTAIFSLDQSIALVAAETLLGPLFQLGFKLAECRASKVLARKPSVFDAFECLKPTTQDTAQDFCRKFRTNRLPALLQFNQRLGGMVYDYMFKDPFGSDEALVHWMNSPDFSRLYASFRTGLHHANVPSRPISRAVNILDALLIIDLALWLEG